MSERQFIQPPEIVKIEGPVVFLAGPIQGAPNWQEEAKSYIHNLEPKITVASPRREYGEGEFDYGKQVDWETHFLRRAAEMGVIAFWLASQQEDTPGRSYTQTSRFEIGEWKQARKSDPSIKLTIGIEPGFGNERYIRRRFGQDCPDVEITDDLEAMCLNAVDLAKPYIG